MFISVLNYNSLSSWQRYGLNEATMNLALETFNNEGKHLADPNNLLRKEGLYRRHTVFPQLWIIVISFHFIFACLGVCLL